MTAEPEPTPETETADVVRLEFRHRYADVRHAARSTFQHGRLGWVFRRAGLVVFAVILVAYLAGGLVSGSLARDPLTALVMVLIPPAVLLMPEWAAYTALRVNPVERRPRQVVIDADGVTVTTDGSAQELGWSTLGGYRETDGYLDLALPEGSGRRFLVLPKRVLGDDADRLRALVSGHLEPLDR